MATRAKRVEEALEREGLRGVFNAIENNPATPGEVVCWAGSGHPVYSVREAIDLAREIDSTEQSEDNDE